MSEKAISRYCPFKELAEEAEKTCNRGLKSLQQRLEKRMEQRLDNTYLNQRLR
jgi:hypothetical protein